MAGHQFVVEGSVDDVLGAVSDAARAADFSVSTDPQGRLVAQKGNFALSIILGAFIAYCDFKFEAQPQGKDAVRLTLTRNNPWWTGLIGIARVKKAATRLADDLQAALGSRVKSRTEV